MKEEKELYRYSKVPIESLVPYEKNARTHPEEQIRNIQASLREFGFVAPILIDNNNMIIAGHGRFEAARREGYKTVPCVCVDDLTEEQKRAYILADNRLAETSDWDMDILKGELEALGQYDMDLDFLGFDELIGGDDSEDPEPVEDEYRAPAVIDERVKLGEIWQLGEHRLMCGDSTDPADVARLMAGQLADLVLTDPPYGVAIGSKNKDINENCFSKKTGRPKGGRIDKDIEGDKGLTGEALKDTLARPAFENARAHSKDKCAIYVTLPPGPPQIPLMQAAAEAGWQVKHGLVWVKNMATFSMGRLDYDYQHEPILYGWNKTHEFYANDYKKSVIEEAAGKDFSKLSKAELVDILDTIFSGPSSVIRENKPTKSDLHPTMKPVKLMGQLISNSSRRGDLVLDLFGGSGTTLIACEQLGRRCAMMEHDTHYASVIVDRWEKDTGKKAKKVS